jgi:zinc D-Ala-D-Ala carboxypeptidase
MDRHTSPPSFAPVPPATAPARSDARPFPTPGVGPAAAGHAPAGRGATRRRRATILVVTVALLAAVAWLAVPAADRGMRAFVTDTFGGSSSGAAGAPGGGAGATGAGQDLPFDEDDARQRDDRIDPFDNDHPAIAGLDDALRDALQAAARDAHDAGVDFWVTSGWRSSAYQQHLLDRAVDRYGSLEEARRFAKTPETSEHVSGEAVDIGPTDGADWTIRKGSRYGLCQTYANEMWHFELATTPGGTCPAPEADAAG